MTLDLHTSAAEELLGAPIALRFCGRIFQRQELQLIGEIARDYAGLAVTEMARTISAESTTEAHVDSSELSLVVLVSVIDDASLGTGSYCGGMLFPPEWGL